MSHQSRGDFTTSAERELPPVVTAFDDPVPSDTVLIEDTVVMSTCGSPHTIEREVQQRLTSEPGLHFSSLVVRRMADGVCIEGILESGNDSDVCSLARQVAGVNEVVNHLLIRRPDPPHSPRPPRRISKPR